MIVCALVGVPLLVTPWAIDPLEIDKVMLVRALGVAAAILLISKKGIAWIKNMDITDPGFWLMIYVGWSAFATIFSINPFRSVFGSMLRGGGLITLICVALLYLGIRSGGELTTHRKKVIARFAIAAATLISLLAIAQYIDKTYLIVNIQPATTGEPYQLIRVAGTFGHPLYVGMYLALMLPFIWFGFRNETRILFKYLFAASGVMMCIALYLTRSRIALIAVIVLGGMMMWKHVHHKKKMFAVMMFIGASTLLIPSVRHTIMRSESLFVRAQEWHFAARLIRERPFFGYGWETYDQISITRERHPNELDDGISDRVHNIWLDTAYAVGIPATLFLAAMFITALMRGYHHHDEWMQTSALSLGIYLILMQTSFDHGITYAMFPFVLAQFTPQESPRHVSWTRVTIAVPLAVLMLAPLASNALMFRATKYLTTGEYEKEIALYRTARAFNPTWPDSDVKEAESWYGWALIQPEYAEQYTDKAEKLMSNARSKGWPWYARAAFEQ